MRPPEPPSAPPRRPATLDELAFERRPPVRWLSPRTLIDAAVRVLVSEAFGTYADKRELQAALDPSPGPPLALDGDEVWLDFVADLGDGFDATYAVASLLAAPELRPAGEPLRRGRLLVLGGDQVYPDPTREGYEHRFRGPYAAALPWTAGEAPHLMAIPGNHDWYDGLTNFLRFFCAGRAVGAWRTRQRRSYFAVQLPHRWWLLGIDVQLDTYIDTPQLEYFCGIDLRPGDKVLLATGKPCWTKLHGGREVPDSYKNIDYFRERVVEAAGAEVAVLLSGDQHHYARYEADDGLQLITSGGGGAYLSATHRLAPALELPDGRRPVLRAVAPDRATSRRLGRGAWRLPVLAPGLAALLGAVHAALAATAAAGLWALWALAAVALAAALATYARPRRALGLAHAAAHLAPATAIGTLLDRALPAAAAGLVEGALLGGLLLGLYLVVAQDHLDQAANDAMAAQAIPDHKGFLRLRLDADGLTVFPIGLRRVPRAWAAAPDDEPGAPWLRPTDVPLAPELLEPPVHVPDDRRTGAPTGAATAAGGPA